MDKSRSRASALRNGKDKAGHLPHSEVKTHSRKTHRDMAMQGKANGGKPQQPMEATNGWPIGQTLLWEWRCSELGYDRWSKRIGPSASLAMARVLAEAIDHDEARIMAFGGKRYTLELRRHGSSEICQYMIRGFPIWKYVANRAD